jgi:DNA-binding transcriptional regulator YdaS (Cro superfamily)
VLGGIALAEAQSVFLPLGPRHAVALGRANKIIRLTSGQVAEVNARQLRGAIDYVYLRPGSPLMDSVRSFAEQRKKARGTVAA